jgi:transketolase
MEIKELEKIASQVRRDIVRMTNGAKSGHPGGSLGCTEYMVALYWEVMDYSNDFKMDGINEDVFFLSNGHISPVWYSVLARAGFFELDELATFRKINSRLQGHPATAEHLPGVRMASGSLGQGLSVALGAALAKKQNNDPHLIYSLHGDGEMQEGQNWEAAMFAAHHRVDNLIATVDFNGQQIDGPTEQVMDLGDLAAKFMAFGWDVLELKDGNNMAAVVDMLRKAGSRTGNGKPVVIIMHAHMGYGVDFMLDNYKWHGVPPNDEQLEQALAQLEETLGDY